jgi:predicted nucleotidyltransferase
LNIDAEQIAAFCEKWGIAELSVFGSVLRDDFGPDSDIDVLVVIRPDVNLTFERWDQMEVELSELTGRRVDLVFKDDIQRSRNWIRRREILSTARVIYAA